MDIKLSKRLDIQIETGIYRIIQESLTNIRKYADTDEAFIQIEIKDQFLFVEIKDQGKGFDMEIQQKGVGLFSIEERARAVGGRLSINSKINSGTTISFVLELRISPLEKGCNLTPGF